MDVCFGAFLTFLAQHAQNQMLRIKLAAAAAATTEIRIKNKD
jgi:hypothetical protein